MMIWKNGILGVRTIASRVKTTAPGVYDLLESKLLLLPVSLIQVLRDRIRGVKVIFMGVMRGGQGGAPPPPGI